MTYSDLAKRVNREYKRIRRKQRLRALVALLVFVAIVVCIYLVASHLAKPWLDKLDRAEAAPVASITVTIAPGDTLWHIARARYPDVDPRDAVHAIRLLNPTIDPGRLQVGQKVIMPEVE